jgi:Spy/CpxP family protein refolding chaperone
MNQAKWLVVGVAVMVVGLSGCMRHHGHGYGGSYREAVLEKGLHETNELIDRIVKDQAKAGQAKGIVADIVAEVRQSGKAGREYHQQLYVLNANYDAAPEDFTKILDDMSHKRMAAASKILGLRFKMKGLLTREEWQELTTEMAKTRARYMPKAEGG